jgi:Ca2+/H+ antiporter
VALAAYLVYETRVRRALESHKGDGTINEQENRTETGEEPHGSKRAGLTRLVGIVLLVVAVLFWVAAPAVLLTPLSTAQKAWTSSAFLVLGEVAFWVAAVALGREVFRRYRRFLDPRDWLGRKRH